MRSLTRNDLTTLMATRGEPCVSLFMPTVRAGSETRQNPIHLKNLLADAHRRLEAVGLRANQATDLLAPATELVEDHDFWQHQSDGLALYLSRDGLREYRLPLSLEPLAVVTDHFHVKPLLPLLTGNGRFYMLALSQNEVRLLVGTRDTVDLVRLRDMPKSLAEALWYDNPEKQLQYHTGTGGTGPAGGRRAAVFHGQGVGKEEYEKDAILRYCRHIDKAVRQVLEGGRDPLVLAGVQYVRSLYREANKHQHLLPDGIDGNPEEMSAEQLHRRAWELVEPVFTKDQQQARAAYEQGVGTGLTADAIDQIVPAAFAGRVGTLFVALDEPIWGAWDPDTGQAEPHPERQADDDDLLEVAASLTLRRDGTVYAVGLDAVPSEAPAAAVLRY